MTRTMLDWHERQVLRYFEDTGPEGRTADRDGVRTPSGWYVTVGGMVASGYLEPVDKVTDSLGMAAAGKYRLTRAGRSALVRS